MLKIQTPIFRLTMHCRQRYYERIIQQEWKGQSFIDSEIWTVFRETPENKSWQNNQKLVDYLKDRYGNCKFKIFQSKEIMFICKRDENISHLFRVVTCFKPNNLNSFQV